MARTETTQEPEVLELPDRYHGENCPQDEDRLEWHETIGTAGQYAGKQIEIIRCVDCGGYKVNTLD